jgi:hypothetical protein
VSTSLPDIGHVTTSQVDGLEIRLARGGQSDGVPILLTSPWPESIAYRAIWPGIEALGSADRDRPAGLPKVIFRS